MTVLLIILHVMVCILLITLVLIQRGRGSGLVESFAGVESMFGTKTNAFLTRTTTVLSIVFFFTCLSLAIIAVRQSKSLLANVKPQAAAAAKAPAAATTPPPAASQQAAQETPKADQK
ncbi:MAG: preprotein translocase subunit SecG [Candidatus Omnitrophica bacterium]|nr:preprotein translocase subunit SecG [Candidatus Omnitrophota bacterium]